MSVEAMGWVLKHSEERLGQRLVLLALADRAHEDGSGSFPSIASLASAARLSKRQTHACLRALEKSGAIRSEGVSEWGTTVWKVVMVEPTAKFALTPNGSAVSDRDECDSLQKHVSETSPKPSLEQPSLKPPREIAHSNELVVRPHRVPRKVNSKLVTDHEDELSRAILNEWNAQTGQKLRATSWLNMVVMRIREYPEMTLADHAEVIAAALRNPWWKGMPTPSVIYGSDAQFERQLTEARNPGKAANLPPAERALALAARLREEGR